MMTFEEFKNYFEHRVMDFMPETFREGKLILERKEVRGEMKHIVGINMPNTDISPIYYLEDMYKSIRAGVPVQEVISGYAAHYASAYKHIPKNLSLDLSSFKAIENKVYYRIENFKRNSRKLESLAYEKILDFAKVYYLAVSPESDFCAPINNQMMEKWGCNLADLKEAAEANIAHNADIHVKALDFSKAAINQEPVLIDHFDCETAIYLVLDGNCFHGATAMLYPSTLKMLGEKLQDDYYVLPSSLHECIVVPKKMGFEPRELGKYVRQVNRAVVAEKEQLSDHVYDYSRERGTLEICPESIEKKRKEMER